MEELKEELDNIKLAKQLLSHSCEYCKHIEAYKMNIDDTFYMCTIHRYHSMGEPTCSDFSYKY